MSAPRRPPILPTHTPALFAEAVAEAAAVLRRGDVVALPTETVYGLAANAFDPKAVARIYEIKGRPSHNPIIVHIATAAMARQCASEWPDSATRLAAAFWPGPMTLVLRRTSLIPDIVTAGGDTVGIRWPGHPFIQAVIRACGFPLAAPSANRSNELSPTNAEHVARSLGDRIPLIVDGGHSQVGIESTVIDVTRRPVRILRPGMIHLSTVQAVVGDRPESSPDSSSSKAPAHSATPPSNAAPLTASSLGPLPSPGMLERHYSPRARLLVRRWRNSDDLIRQLNTLGVAPRECHVIVHTNIPSHADAFASIRVIPHDAEAYARALYAELHRCDDEGARCIVAEEVPETPEWSGIGDRLRRASAS